MYNLLKSKITLCESTQKEFSKKIGMSYTTFNSKLSGKTSFTLDEAIKIKEQLSDAAPEPLEILFVK